MAASNTTRGPLELLILQPTPFCNLDCSYCYLPDRQATDRMSLETVEKTLDWVFSSGIVQGPFTMLWHAGEPLVVPIDFYEQAISLLAKYNTADVTIRHAFQTNATLINTEWCDFIKRHALNIGVSVDGPAFLHDRYRRTRQGKGTLDRVLRGIHQLRDAGIPYFALSVLTAESLHYPDELYDFYREHGIKSVGFNTEEIEGPNVTSSLLGDDKPALFRKFFSRFVDLALSTDPPMVVREFDGAVEVLLQTRYHAGDRTQESKPWAILNVAWDGSLSTFSPELLGISGAKYGSFTMGNVYRDTIADVVASAHFQRIDADIVEGIERCRQTCSYFALCGGGTPANKYFENGSFATTETLFCRLHKKICLDVAMDKMEQLRATHSLVLTPEADTASERVPV